MKTTPITKHDISQSVIAVPPLARNADFTINREANAALIRHLESGGVRSLMYGGNANFYHLGVNEYAGVVDFLADTVGEDTWLLPSIGPDYGKALDQAAILRNKPVPTAMLLPMSFPFTNEGLAIGIRRITDALGKPAVIYIKADEYIQPDTLAELFDEGRVTSIKYAVVRNNPDVDPYLRKLVDVIDKDLIVSGIGERPAIIHLRDYGLMSFTSGSVCVAPRGSMHLLHLIKERRFEEAATLREAYLPLEDLRDAISPIRVLHEAVTLSGVADMGPMLPMLSGLSDDTRARVLPAAKALLEHDRGLVSTLAHH
ncbi:MAG: dihydrodipicolinate synthase family protein [Candidatus Protistobacter heckmanni]|nr:dihydrodipicolinate synthase family protein [Candidatus Protistobacter heckmanni]